MATIEEELGQLERDIRQLKIEYDQYFGGGRKRPPTEIEWRIDLLVKRYAERGGELKFGQRFRFNNLSQTYAKYKDIFRKKLQQKEEGKVPRHFGAAARAIEAARAQKEGEEKPGAAATQPTEAEPKPAVTATETAEPQPTAAVESQVFRVTCSEPERETEKIDQLYRAFVQAKVQTGEQAGKLSRNGFNEFVLKKTRELKKQKNCRAVEYVVEVVEGQVKLKALVKA
jgi:hypothetical protein